jgi:hypothetical protein
MFPNDSIDGMNQRKVKFTELFLSSISYKCVHDALEIVDIKCGCILDFPSHLLLLAVVSQLALVTCCTLVLVVVFFLCYM